MGAFSSCKLLTSVKIPEGITAIQSNMFNGCSNLTSVSLPSALEAIGTDAFRLTPALNSITIPCGVQSIGARAFLSSGLTSVDILSSVLSIGELTFGLCPNLEQFSLAVQNPADITLGSNAFYNTPVDAATLYVPHGTSGLYRSSAAEWAFFGDIQDKPNKITIGPDFIINRDKTLSLAEKIPADASVVRWESSNTRVAAVDSRGVVTANKLGTTTVSAFAVGGEKFSWTVKVDLRWWQVVLLMLGIGVFLLPLWTA